MEDWYWGWDAVQEADHNDIEDKQKLVTADWVIVDALLEGGFDPIPYDDGESLLSDDNLRDCFAEVLVRAKEQWLERQWNREWEPVDELKRPEKA